MMIERDEGKRVIRSGFKLTALSGFAFALSSASGW